ncbi:hypothetical protein [Flammeovirga agarivorans]|uniref:Tetratricopeptide repeat-containing protein n=1 Tax=Flammeovirga agarivorans TaxID=2726742 RepID=A0A7X8SM67_9BACT|nr:hypothetical protein [Flammeovirga agarivorans]NLR92789.1 hypothetical protein [Flammeovirga agarivorans]
MYSVTEIYQLREEGKYQEAFITARRLLELSPNDESLQAAMAWVLYDMIKVAADENNIDSFEELFSVFVEYVPLEADKLQQMGCYILYNMVERCITKQDYKKANDLMLLIEGLKFHPDKERPHGFYQLLEVAVAFSQQLPEFLKFIKVWRLQNLLPKHYQQYGEAMSIAEKVHWLVGQHLLQKKNDNEEVINAYVKQLDLLLSRYPHFKHITKLRAKLVE